MRLCLLLCLSTPLFAQFPTVGERWGHYLYRTYSWQRMSLLGADSLVDHVLLDPAAFDRGPGGYWCRYSSGFGRRIVRNSIEFGAGFVLREDLRYRRSPDRGILARLRMATTSAVLAYDPAGGQHFAWSRLAANTGASMISASWQPYRNGTGRVAGNFAWSYVGQIENNLLSEFAPDILHLGKKVRTRFFRR
ncbi:MAG TPA: hypothetical protein VG672_08640 [Bryobacteraceae bacterium]|nr:hypothetical protein [Bryobacteraceae bacterium]